METSIEPLKTSLIKEAIASGIGRNKIRDHATKAAAYLKDMLEKQKPLKYLSEFEKSLEVEYNSMKW